MPLPDRNIRSWMRASLWLLVLVAISGAAGCSVSGCLRRHVSAPLRPGDDRADVIHRIRLQDAQAVQRDSVDLPPDTYSWWTRQDGVAPAPPPAHDKVHPRLRTELSALGASDRVRVLVAYRDTLQMVRFPAAVPVALGFVPDSVRLAAASNLALTMQTLRIGEFRKDSTRIAQLGGSVIERFWLSRSLLVDVPKSAVPGLEADSDVVYIRGERAGEGPPTGPCDATPMPCAARQQIRSDPYFEAGYGRGTFALLDTGVRPDHRMLTGAWSRLTELRDCVDGGEDCRSLTHRDRCEGGHGTVAAGILSGHVDPENTADPVPAEYRGVTEASIESYNVYGPCAGCGHCADLVATAAKRAFEVAVTRGPPVIVAEIAGFDPEDLVLIGAAERAYDAGRVVIAANGNEAAQIAGSPASAGVVMGVGAYDVRMPSANGPVNNLSGGVLSIGRMKPDVLAPSGTESAGSANSGAYHPFSATSGATPYAAGAALMLWNLLRGENADIDPGLVYAGLVLAARGSPPFNSSSKSGAGAIRLPTDCWLLFGKVDLVHGEQNKPPLPIGGAIPSWIEAAIWWPEHSLDSRRNIDLELLRPNGSTTGQPGGSSLSTETVFERVRVDGPLTAGEWKLHIKATNVPSGVIQTVYWIAALGLP